MAPRMLRLPLSLMWKMPKQDSQLLKLQRSLRNTSPLLALSKPLLSRKVQRRKMSFFPRRRLHTVTSTQTKPNRHSSPRQARKWLPQSRSQSKSRWLSRGLPCRTRSASSLTAWLWRVESRMGSSRTWGGTMMTMWTRATRRRSRKGSTVSVTEIVNL